MSDNSYPVSRDFRLTFEELSSIGQGVNRPECVLALSDERLVTGNGAGGYSVVERDGRVRHVLALGSEGRRYHPNGIAVAPDGRVVFAHLGATDGGVFSIDARGNVQTVVDAIDGKPLPPTNYVSVLDSGAVWFTVSTRLTPRSLAWNKTVTDGFIAVKDAKGVRVLADSLGYTNEIAFSPDGGWVYVNETYAQRVSRFALRPDGSLGAREVVAQFGNADLPDGLTFDSRGGLWVTCIASNRLLLVRPDGDVQVVLDESDAAHASKIAGGIQAGSLAWEDMQGLPGDSRLRNLSSLAFGGAGMKTAYMGSLMGDCIRTFECPIEGAQPAHYKRRLA